jgi:hypothetical protein
LWQIVVDRFRNADHGQIQPLISREMGDLGRRQHRTAAAVINECPDIMCTQHLDQSGILFRMRFRRSQICPARTESPARRMPERRQLGGILAG